MHGTRKRPQELERYNYLSECILQSPEYLGFHSSRKKLVERLTNELIKARDSGYQAGYQAGVKSKSYKKTTGE